MADIGNLQQTFDKLAQTRDELRVKYSLGKMEADDRWKEIQDNFEDLEAKMDQFRDQGESELDRMKEDIELLMSDIRDGFNRLKNQS